MIEYRDISVSLAAKCSTILAKHCVLAECMDIMKGLCSPVSLFLSLFGWNEGLTMASHESVGILFWDIQEKLQKKFILEVLPEGNRYKKTLSF